MAASSLDSPEEGFVEEDMLRGNSVELAAGGLVVPTPRRVKFKQDPAPRSAAAARGPQNPRSATRNVIIEKPMHR